MKKTILFTLTVTTLLFASCNNSGPNKAQLSHENDSLQNIIAQRDATLDEMIASINMVQEGFLAINEAQGRINLEAAGGEHTSTQNLQSEINFIRETMQQNKTQIEELKKQLAGSNNQSKQLKVMIEKLQTQLNEKNSQIESLQTLLSEKNMKIEELDKTISSLTGNVSSLKQTTDNQEIPITKQNSELSTVWYAIGTKRELKAQNILDGGDVLSSANINKEYFTKGDLRELTTINTHSTSAKLLTTHPKDSYTFNKNEQKHYVLRITNPESFWSITKFLVIQVR